MKHFQPGLKLRLETDASQFAISAIVSQLFASGEHSEWHPIAFWSRKLNLAEYNYETYNSELLAIIEGFKHYRQYLEGAPYTI